LQSSVASRRFLVPAGIDDDDVERSVSDRLVCVVPNRSSPHDPGLLLCSPSGELRFWESLTHSLPDAFMTTDLGLPVGDQAVTLLSTEVTTNPPSSLLLFLLAAAAAADDDPFLLPRSKPAGFVLATQAGLLFQIFLTNALGQPGFSYSQLARPVGVFARFGSMFGLGYDPFANRPLRVLSHANETGHSR